MENWLNDLFLVEACYIHKAIKIFWNLREKIDVVKLGHLSLTTSIFPGKMIDIWHNMLA